MSERNKAPRPMADETSELLQAGAGLEPATPPVRPAPRIDRISKRAYEIYEERGGDHGFDESDWLQAEREIREAQLEHEFDGADSNS